MRSLLTGEPSHLRVFLEVLLNDFVTPNILMELEISKLVEGFKLNDGRMPDEGRHFPGGIKNGLDDRSFFPLNFGWKVLHNTVL